MKQIYQRIAFRNSFPDGKSARPSRLGPSEGTEIAFGKSIFRANFESINGRLRWHLRRWHLDKEHRAMLPTEVALLIAPTDLPRLYSFIGEALARARHDGLLVLPEHR
jgi:hypothetical protein